jgi:hypothetical protein
VQKKKKEGKQLSLSLSLSPSLSLSLCFLKNNNPVGASSSCFLLKLN